jgi:hypothetical protein
MMIYIGAIFGGPELGFASPVARAIMKLQDSRDPEEEGDFGSLDIVFHVAGSLVQPEFRGVRTGSFSRKKRMLQVQIAVPAEVVASPDPYAFVAGSLREAVRVAAPIFAKAGIRYPEEEYVAVADKLVKLGLQ